MATVAVIWRPLAVRPIAVRRDPPSSARTLLAPCRPPIRKSLRATPAARHIGHHDDHAKQWTTFIDHPVVEWTIFAVGVLLLLLVAPLVGAIPGPGGIFVFAIGLAMVLKTSMWAKRRYVRFKRWQPKAGALGRLGR